MYSQKKLALYKYEKYGTIFDQKFLFLNGFTNKKLSADQSDLDGV